MWSPHDGLSIPTDLLPQSWRVDRGRPHIPSSGLIYPPQASYTLLTSDLAVRQQFANDKLWEMLTMPLALCRWQPVNVREVTCSASPWRWHVAREVTLVTFCTSLLPILILQILIDLNHAMDVVVLMWGCLLRQGGQVFYITGKCNICPLPGVIYCRPLFTFTKKYLGVENTLTVEWRNIVGGMQYRLTLCYGMHHHLLLFTAYYGLTQIIGVGAKADVLLRRQRKALRNLSPKTFQ